MEIQITAIKFETVNGKKTGKSFTFKLDPKKMAVYKTEATSPVGYIQMDETFTRERRLHPFTLDAVQPSLYCGYAYAEAD